MNVYNKSGRRTGENYMRTIGKLKFSVNFQYFPYQIISRILLRNKKLKHFKLVEEDLCSFCKQGTDTIEYVFYSCPEVQNLWSKFRHWLKNINKDDFKLMATDVYWVLTEEIHY